MNKTCRTCRWLMVTPDSDGKKRIRKDTLYRCAAPWPDIPPLSKATLKSWWYAGVLEEWGRQHWTNPDVADCELWDQREKEGKKK